MRSAFRDLTYSLRLLRRSPWFATATLLTIALGVGANTAAFSVARSLLFRPLPMREPERLVALWNEQTQTSARTRASWPQLTEWRSRKHLFESAAAYSYDEDFAAPAAAAAESAQVTRIRVTRDFFDVIGRQPLLGRAFSDADWRPAPSAAAIPQPAVITFGMWKARFGGNKTILGQTIRVNGDPYTIIGVMPKDFEFFRNDRSDLLIPLSAPAAHLTDRRRLYLDVVARLQPGVSIDMARKELESLSRRNAGEYPRTDAGLISRIAALHDDICGHGRPLIALLLGAVGIVLSIACANVAGLLLARGLHRGKELAIRTAIGAGRLRIVRLLLTESIVLSLMGAGLGLVLAAWGLDLFTLFASRASLGLPEIRIDRQVIGLTALIAAASGIAFGLVPAVYGSRVRLNESLKDAASASAGTASHRATGLLVISEMALSLVLLIGAGLLLQSLVRLLNAPVGFRSERVLTMAIGDIEWNRGFVAREQRFWPELLQRVEALPQVETAALSHAFPFSAEKAAVNIRAPITIEGGQLPPPGQVFAEYQSVTPGYFRAVGIPIRRGRAFEARDLPDNAPAQVPPVVINESLARMLWGTTDAVGKRLITPQRTLIVAGIAGDVKQHGPRLPAPAAHVYEPLWYSNFFKLGRHYLIVKTSGDPLGVTASVKEAVAVLDPERAVNLVRTIEQVAVQRTAWDRIGVLVAGIFAALALLVTAVGTYALISYSVSRRIREFGIRIALGGRPADIFRLVLGQGLALAAAGITTGVAAAILLTRWLNSILFGISATDAVTYAVASTLLAAITAAACYLPARSATQVDPLAALRSE